MKSRGSDRLLNWGFAIALTLHGLALAGAACVPAQALKDDLSEIRVFNADAPALMVPVELVEVPTPARVPEVERPAVVLPAPPPPQTPKPKPTVEKPVVPEARPKESSRPATVVEKPPAPQPAPRPKPLIPNPRPVAEPPRPATPPAATGGGGGGGFVDLGTPSAGGEVAAPSGGTPMGEVPGAGSGAGAGSGPGEGGGSGGGSGGGTGEGRGSGTGPGAGDGTETGSGFVSSTADRREPVVISKGNLEYPSSAVADGVEGVVKLSVLVSERGTVEKVKVVESSRDRRLDSAALEFVRGWRYRPAVQDGKPRSVSTYAVVEFELK